MASSPSFSKESELICRAYTSSKACAFAAPIVLSNDRFDYSYDFQKNALNEAELALAATYDRLGRCDLGDFVRNGKCYQLLDEYYRGCINLSHASLNAFRRAWLDIPDENAGKEPRSREEWIKVARERYRGDPGLEDFVIQRTIESNTCLCGECDGPLW